ncbi:inositol monophosphatase family protein [Vagococcus sp. CY53-2]|uniref:inositol monophosphatase family protein n=1 Tax=Vagococcus sp. CY53-2 TaxID=2925780 RepID=UPI001F514C7B|nr:inositol monophosphatase family protein [Vagococcus sp. CY53-2]MCI0129760.1 inositol monophosphatase family protein [Vagococcus sp. CY53-2]
MDNKQLMLQVKQWMEEAGQYIKDELKQVVTVEEKTNRSDLVTNVDKGTEAFLVKKINEAYPNDLIIGEEGTGREVSSTKGRIWIIDPIDGTLNFVKQQENFCVMIGIFEDGNPLLGFIYDVMKNEFVYGGPSTGVYLNGTPLHAPEDSSLADGLLGCNVGMYSENYEHSREIASAAIGVRMLGCAGLDFLNVLRGTQNAYISNLAPWDFAAGTVLAEALGLVCRQFPDLDYNILGKRQYFIVATPQTFRDIQKFFKNK